MSADRWGDLSNGFQQNLVAMDRVRKRQLVREIDRHPLKYTWFIRFGLESGRLPVRCGLDHFMLHSRTSTDEVAASALVRCGAMTQPGAKREAVKCWVHPRPARRVYRERE